jgi:hypothetical protein
VSYLFHFGRSEEPNGGALCNHIVHLVVELGQGEQARQRHGSNRRRVDQYRREPVEE